MKLSIDPKTRHLLIKIDGFLAEQGIRAHVIGGLIRDALLGRETIDIDIALDADALTVAPKLAAEVGGKFVTLDEVNRVGRVIVAILEADTSACQWEIDLATVRGNIEDDMRQRDFTIDAMAIELGAIAAKTKQEEIEAQLIDPYHGRDDLHRRVVRATVETAFAADAIRLLRAIRLAAELDFSIDAATESLIRRDSHLITDVAAERVRDELVRLLAHDCRFLRRLDALGLLTAIIPELAPLKGVQQPPEHFWDVFDHSLETVATVDFLLRQGNLDYAAADILKSVTWSPALTEHFAGAVSHGSTRRSLLKMAALLHDIAKPQTKAIMENGRMRFLGHAQEGADIATGILKRLRFSGRETSLVAAMVKNHLRPAQLSQRTPPTRRAIYRYFRDTGDAGIDTLYLSLADHLAARGPRLEIKDWQEHAEVVDYILAQRSGEDNLIVPPKLIDGHDLMNVFHLPGGPRLGELLEAVREAQAAGEVNTRGEALDYVRRQLSFPAG